MREHLAVIARKAGQVVVNGGHEPQDNRYSAPMLRAFTFLILVVVGCDSAEKPFTTNCTTAAPTAEAARAPGRVAAGVAMLPGGRQVTPAGKLLDVGGYPIAMRVLPGDR